MLDESELESVESMLQAHCYRFFLFTKVVPGGGGGGSEEVGVSVGAASAGAHAWGANSSLSSWPWKGQGVKISSGGGTLYRDGGCCYINIVQVPNREGLKISLSDTHTNVLFAYSGRRHGVQLIQGNVFLSCTFPHFNSSTFHTPC